MGISSNAADRATDWVWRCPTCGHTGPERRAGGLVLRIGASGTTRSLGRCSACDAWRMLIRERSAPTGGGGGTAGAAGRGAGGTASTSSPDQERTWSELIAYVSEGTMSAETANRLAACTAPESRKREVAAHVAEGAISVNDALTLLGG